MQSTKILIDTAIKYGASTAAIIPISDIPFYIEFREACKQNTCGKYSKCWMCPPDIGDAGEMISHAKSFTYALIMQTISKLEDSFFGAGGCHLCPHCAKLDDTPCHSPQKAIAPLEAYGISVSELAAICKLNYINGPNTVTYFGGVLFK